MSKSMDARNGVKFEVGDKVRVIGADGELDKYSCSARYGKVYTVKTVGSKNIDYELEGTNWVKAHHLEPASLNLTKAEWLIELCKGKIGVQSGNSAQRWRYNVDKECFESKLYDRWEHRDISSLNSSSREYSILGNVEMTIEEIENALGINNLKVVS